MSRCTPSRLTSGPWPPSRPGDLVDLVDEDDAGLLDRARPRSRATLSMSISFCSSSCVRYSSASGTFSLRLLRLALEQPGQHVLEVDVHFLDRRAGDDLERRKRLLADVDFDDAAVEAAGAELLAEALARLLLLIADASRGPRPARSGATAAAGCRAADPRRSAPPSRALPRARSLAHHVDAELDEVAHHRLDVAADVADLGELRRPRP